jgi:hypothetical protein
MSQKEIGRFCDGWSREIDLIERLHREARSPKYAGSTRSYMLRDRNVSVLKERRAILEALKKAKARQADNLKTG